MKKWVLLSVGILVLTLSGCSKDSAEVNNDVTIPASAKDFKKENYEDVQLQLEKAGFTNIEIKSIDDLITGWLTSDGEVEKVSIDGVTDFSENDTFDKDSKVVITYHTFKEESSDVSSESSSSSTSSSTSSFTTEAKESTSESKVSKQSTDEIITAENNEEFSYILSSNDDYNAYKAFADKYKGKTIQFDGSIVSVIKHNNFKTRFDFLIYGGDYSTTTSTGAPFQINNANYYDLKLTGNNVPDSITEGINITITAKVIDYSQGDLIIIEPVEIRIR